MGLVGMYLSLDMHCDGFMLYNCKKLFWLTCICFAGALYLLFAGCHLCSGQTSCKSILYFGSEWWYGTKKIVVIISQKDVLWLKLSQHQIHQLHIQCVPMLLCMHVESMQIYRVSWLKIIWRKALAETFAAPIHASYISSLHSSDTCTLTCVINMHICRPMQ